MTIETYWPDAATRAEFARRANVAAIVERPSGKRGKNGLGRSRRLSGQSRVPEPPAIATAQRRGKSKVALAAEAAGAGIGDIATIRYI